MLSFTACVDWVLDEALDDALQTTVDSGWDQADDSFRSARSGHGDHILALWFDQEPDSQEGAACAARDRVGDFAASIPISGRIGRVVVYSEEVAIVLDPPSGIDTD